jgi:hypothetical protein
LRGRTWRERHVIEICRVYAWLAARTDYQPLVVAVSVFDAIACRNACVISTAIYVSCRSPSYILECMCHQYRYICVLQIAFIYTCNHSGEKSRAAYARCLLHARRAALAWRCPLVACEVCGCGPWYKAAAVTCRYFRALQCRICPRHRTYSSRTAALSWWRNRAPRQYHFMCLQFHYVQPYMCSQCLGMLRMCPCRTKDRRIPIPLRPWARSSRCRQARLCKPRSRRLVRLEKWSPIWTISPTPVFYALLSLRTPRPWS